MALLQITCPTCHSAVLPSHTTSATQYPGPRLRYKWTNGPPSFSATNKTCMAGLQTPVSVIWQVGKARTEGRGLHAATRPFAKAKQTLLAWARTWRTLQQVLFLSALVHEVIAWVIAGDAASPKVQTHGPPAQSPGWPIRLRDRARRVIGEIACGKQARTRLRQALPSLAMSARQPQELRLLTDGERR